MGIGEKCGFSLTYPGTLLDAVCRGGDACCGPGPTIEPPWNQRSSNTMSHSCNVDSRCGIHDTDGSQLVSIPVPETASEHHSEFIGPSPMLLQLEGWGKNVMAVPETYIQHQQDHFQLCLSDNDEEAPDNMDPKLYDEVCEVASDTITDHADVTEAYSSRNLPAICSEKIELEQCLYSDHVEINLHYDKKSKMDKWYAGMNKLGFQDQARNTSLPSLLGVEMRNTSIGNSFTSCHEKEFNDIYPECKHVELESEVAHESWKQVSQTYKRGEHWHKLEWELLGKGSFGTCYLGLDVTDNSYIAVKEQMISKHCTSEAVAAEVNILSRLRHPNILQYYRHTHEDNIVYIFTRWMQGGSLDKLLNRLANESQVIPQKTTMWLTQQILQGLDYLHCNSILHRDIKPANILLDEVCEEVVLADFGLSLCLDSGQSVITGPAMEGTLGYMAPESVQSYQYGKTSDVWGVGCIIFEMSTSLTLWSVTEPQQLIFQVGMAKDPPGKLSSARHLGLSDEVLTLITCCLKVTPQERPSTKQLLNLLIEQNQKNGLQDLGQADLKHDPCTMESTSEEHRQKDHSMCVGGLPSTMLQLDFIEDPDDMLWT